MDEAVINITVPTYNRLEFTKRTLASVKKHTRTQHVLTVVDNGSTDGTPEFLVKLAQDGLIDNLILFRRNMGVSCAANMGFDIGMKPLYMKLDNDMEVVRPDWLSPLVSLWCDNPEVALIGPKLPGSGHPFGTVTLGSGATVLHALSNLSGAALLVAKDVFNKLGYFSEDYGLYGEEDADYSHRAKEAGYLLTAFDTRGVVNHLGEWSVDQESYVAFKTSSRDRNTRSKRGINLFGLHCYLYNHRLLPLFVPRKYLPVKAQGYYWDVTLNKDYVLRRKFVLECKKIIDAVPVARWDEVLNSEEFVSGLRGLQSHQGW
jgi:GT2 family glycosyltransferase